jgi:hypothetical protein
MKLDRALQLEILRMLEDAYPSYLRSDVATQFCNTHTEDKVFSNLLYLEGHGLLTSGLKMGLNDFVWNVGAARISSAGLDFLADDGGLTAVLGIVTVKLHEDTIKDLLIKHIEKEPGSDPTVKSELIKQVKSLPAEGLKTLTTKTLEAGIAALPSLVPLLRTWLGGV